jgi:hypothetical protein
MLACGQSILLFQDSEHTNVELASVEMSCCLPIQSFYTALCQSVNALMWAVDFTGYYTGSEFLQNFALLFIVSFELEALAPLMFGFN